MDSNPKRFVTCDICGFRGWVAARSRDGRRMAITSRCPHCDGIAYTNAGGVAPCSLSYGPWLKVDLNHTDEGECTYDCRHSESGKCRCSCKGENHGIDVSPWGER